MTSILDVLTEHFVPFLKATGITLQLTGVSLVIAVFIGLFFALFSLSHNRLLNLLSTVYVGIVRGLPLIVQLMFLYYGIAKIVTLPRFWAGAIALGLHAGAYVAEIFRGAIQSIDFGQSEAAHSLGMSKFQTMRLVILPQAFRRAIPPLGNQFIIGLKDSSLVGLLGVPEVYNLSKSIVAENYKPFETFMVAGLYYLVLVLIFSALVHRLETHLNKGKRKANA